MKTKTSRAHTKPTKVSIDPKGAERIATKAATTALAQYDATHVAEVVDAALDKALPEALNTMLEKLGVDVSDKESREEFRKDILHLRESRTFIEMLKKEGVKTTVKWIYTSLLALLVLGLAAVIYRHS